MNVKIMKIQLINNLKMSTDYIIVSENISTNTSNDSNDSVVINIKKSVDIKPELKGILRKTSQINVDDTDKIIKTFLSIFITILALPFIVCDLYYAYNDSSCVQEYPKKFNINLKIYLLLSGYTLLSNITIIIFGLCMTSKRYTDIINISVIILLGIFMIICGLFNVIWNIIGAIVFWGNIYKNDNCDNNISTYVFVSLIIKLFANFMFIFYLRNNYKK
jgi:hypothetical protein